MAKTRKKRFAFSKEKDLHCDSKGADTSVLQSYLTCFGYLRGSYEPGVFCNSTDRAVRRYQRFYGLKVDGLVGPKTKKHMERPRCGVADAAPLSAPFVLRGCKYERRSLRYAFLNSTADLGGDREQEIVRQAFDAWANVADLEFTEVQANEGPHFRIAWRAADHGDGSSFDGPGNTLAHAFFPPPCGGVNAGDLHFDEAERWIEDPGSNGILLLQVAIHEIGHLLGLSHSQDEEAIMFAFYSPDRVNLAQDDIDGVRALYGARTENEELVLTAGAQGNLARGGAERIYELEVPRSLAVSIDGPANADFDLYVRKDQPPTESEYDFRAFTVSSDERILFPAEAGARYFVMVRSFDGSGDYRLKVEPSAS